jgi:hypothetical protein
VSIEDKPERRKRNDAEIASALRYLRRAACSFTLIVNPVSGDNATVEEYAGTKRKPWLSRDERAAAIKSGRLVEAQLQVFPGRNEQTIWGDDIGAIVIECARRTQAAKQEEAEEQELSAQKQRERIKRDQEKQSPKLLKRLARLKRKKRKT